MPIRDHIRSAPSTRGTSWQPGRIVADRYRIEALLGRGGMGTVWRVRDLSLERDLALKQLAEGASAKVAMLFQREYHTLAGLRHPHIVAVHEYGKDGPSSYYTMELLEGEDLRELAPMPWREVCRCLRDAASALALLHARRLLHRDVSPRNLWRSRDGRYKLIDFGAMAAFGAPGDIVGTPPCIPPEAFHGQPLDQRAEMYALGALGYWLLTGMHAYPAHRLNELPELWTQAPQPVARHVALLERDDLPDVPEQLATLVDALLSQNPSARPRNAADVIDRLDAVTGHEPAAPTEAVEGYLESQRFVGRARERRLLRKRLRAATEGKGYSVLVEATAGLGRSRLLQELALDARLEGTTVLQTEAGLHDGSHGVAEALAVKLLDALPELARRLAEPHAGVLAHLSPRIRERLGPVELVQMPQAAGESRMRIQAALRDWVLDVGREHALSILVDDAHVLDDASAAWFAALAHECRAHRLLLVLTWSRDGGGAMGPAMRSFLGASQHCVLEPLTRAESLELFESIFGDPPYLPRLVERVHRISAGNPSHGMALAEHLVRENVIAYVGGTWTLPQDPSAAELPASLDAAWEARLERLAPTSRALAQVLSIHAGVLPLPLCVDVAETPAVETFSALDELVSHGVLIGSADGYRFGHDGLRERLLAGLDRERRRRAHARLGQVLLQSEALGTRERLEAGVHLLRGGDLQRGGALVARAGIQLVIAEPETLAEVVPALQEALSCLRAEGRPSYELVALLAPLANAAFYADRRLIGHADEAIEALSELVGLKRAAALRPRWGRKLSLAVGLGGAALRLRRLSKDPRVPTFREGMLMLFNCVATTVGTHVICIDPHSALRYARVIEPLTVLGSAHVASFVHEFCLGLIGTVQDRLGEGYARWQRLLERLESPDPIKDMPDHVRQLYLGGALYACGVMESWRDGPGVLRMAERLDALGMKLYEMSADQLRTMYYANQGNLELFERYRDRVEMHAIQRGTAWQVETWGPSASITAYVRAHDAMGLRRVVEQLQRLSRELPSLELYVRRARGAYLLLRGRSDEALVLLREALDEEPLAIVGWGRGHGILARAYNMRGEHAQALEVCRNALSYLTEADLEFAAMNGMLQTEHAIAEAGLGHHARAAVRLESLIARHQEDQGPLTLGALHEARAEVARMAGDDEAFRLFRDASRRWYDITGIPSLMERGERLSLADREARDPNTASGADTSTSLTEQRVTSLVGAREMPFETRARHALKLITEQSPEVPAYLLVYTDDQLRLVAASCEQTLPEDVKAWVAVHLATLDEEEDTTLDDEGSGTERHSIPTRGHGYRFVPLFDPRPGGEVVVGALVFDDPDDACVLPGARWLHLMARHLREAVEQEDA